MQASPVGILSPRIGCSGPQSTARSSRRSLMKSGSCHRDVTGGSLPSSHLTCLAPAGCHGCGGAAGEAVGQALTHQAATPRLHRAAGACALCSLKFVQNLDTTSRDVPTGPICCDCRLSALWGAAGETIGQALMHQPTVAWAIVVQALTDL